MDLRDISKQNQQNWKLIAKSRGVDSEQGGTDKVEGDWRLYSSEEGDAVNKSYFQIYLRDR